MVYATCTYNPAENEAVVAHLLKREEALLLPIDLDLPSQPGLTAWGSEIYGEQLARTFRFYPHQVDSVGFFVAGIGKPC